MTETRVYLAVSILFAILGIGLFIAWVAIAKNEFDLLIAVLSLVGFEGLAYVLFRKKEGKNSKT